MDDIFDRDDDEDDDRENYGIRNGLPDLDIDEGVVRAEDQPQDDREEDEVLANLKNLSKGAAKKKVQRPQPKLDAERLKSDRGLPALTNLFSAVRFKGRGHEAEDLKLLMRTAEHWSHRLFPKMSFDDFIERLERLGAKKEIQTCVKRICLDLPVAGDDPVQQPEDRDSVHENVDQNMSDDDAAMNVSDDVGHIENERRAVCSSPSSVFPHVTSTASQIAQSTSTSPMPSFSPPSSIVLDSPIEYLTPEQQKQRIDRNRLLALQKRAQRLGQQGQVSSLSDETG